MTWVIMEREILKERKTMKQKAIQVIKGHYVLLIFMTLVLTVFCNEFNYSISSWGRIFTTEEIADGEPEEKDPGNMLEDDKGFASKVVKKILEGRLEESRRESDRITEEIKERTKNAPVLGLANGVLAEFVSSVISGRLTVMFAQSLRTIFKNRTAVSIAFVILSFLFYALIFIFLKNVFSAIIRRLYLAARVYGKVQMSTLVYFLLTGQWIRASWTMFVKELRLFLWSLTIVGGIIKEYSYWAVPFIVAENPSVKSDEAITLSRKMMDGHKVELFLYQLTFFGWILLGQITFGITDLVFGNAYRLAAYTEFYAKLRALYLEKEPAAAAVLNDVYLYEKADRVLLAETYFDVVDEITLIHEKETDGEPLTGVKKKLADWFGIWVGTLKSKKKYDNVEGRKQTIRSYKECMGGEAYPNWLSPLWKNRTIKKLGHFNFQRSYSVWTLFLLFILFSFVGWLWEVALHFMQTGEFANRGVLIGPWLPIYGSGGIVVLMLCNRFRGNPVAEFFVAMGLCGTIEYIAGWALETTYHTRWWSYDGYFLNLHGRICAEGLLVFGVACCIVVYLIAPVFDYILSMLNEKIVIGVTIVLAVLFTADAVHSNSHPNMGEGAIESAAVDETYSPAASAAEEASSAAAVAETGAGSSAEAVEAAA